MTRETAGAGPESPSVAGRLAWGALGLFLFAWTVFEAVKHTGLTIPLAVAGLLVPFLAGLAPDTPAAQRVLLGVWIPLAVVLVRTVVPGPAENTAAPFTFGTAWLTHLALRRAPDHGLRST
ncbi:hypothetical protein [Streptomyces sp. NPDC001770]